GWYRSIMANWDGGPSQGHFEQQWATDARFRNFQRLMAWDPNAPGSLRLGTEWYRSLSTNQNIAVLGVFCGFQFRGPELATVAGAGLALYGGRALILKALARAGLTALAGAAGTALGGPAAVALLAYQVYSWTKWDTTFWVTSGI